MYHLIHITVLLAFSSHVLGQRAADPFWIPRVTPLDSFNDQLVASVAPGAAPNTRVTVLSPQQTGDPVEQAWFDSLTVTVVDLVTLSMNLYTETYINLGGANVVTRQVISSTLTGVCTLDSSKVSARCSGTWAVTEALVESGKAGATTLSSSIASNKLSSLVPVEQIMVVITARGADDGVPNTGNMNAPLTTTQSSTLPSTTSSQAGSTSTQPQPESQRSYMSTTTSPVTGGAIRTSSSTSSVGTQQRPPRSTATSLATSASPGGGVVPRATNNLVLAGAAAMVGLLVV